MGAVVAVVVVECPFGFTLDCKDCGGGGRLQQMAEGRRRRQRAAQSIISRRPQRKAWGRGANEDVMRDA